MVGAAMEAEAGVAAQVMEMEAKAGAASVVGEGEWEMVAEDEEKAVAGLAAAKGRGVEDWATQAARRGLEVRERCQS